MFGLLVFKPVLPLPGIGVFPRLPRIGEPIGPLPTSRFTKHGTPFLKVFVQRAASHTARGCKLAIGKMVGIKQTQRFADPLFQIFAIALERLRAADVNFP